MGRTTRDCSDGAPPQGASSEPATQVNDDGRLADVAFGPATMGQVTPAASTVSNVLPHVSIVRRRPGTKEGPTSIAKSACGRASSGSPTAHGVLNKRGDAAVSWNAPVAPAAPCSVAVRALPSDDWHAHSGALGVAEGDTGEAVAVAVADGELLAVPLAEGDGEPVPVADALGVSVDDAEPVPVADELGVHELELELLSVWEADAVSVGDVEDVPVMVADVEAVRDAEPVCVELALLLLLTDVLGVCEPVGELVGVHVDSGVGGGHVQPHPQQHA